MIWQFQDMDIYYILYIIHIDKMMYIYTHMRICIIYNYL